MRTSRLIMTTHDPVWIPCGSRVVQALVWDPVWCRRVLGPVWIPCGSCVVQALVWDPMWCRRVLDPVWIPCGSRVDPVWIPCGAGASVGSRVVQARRQLLLARR